MKRITGLDVARSWAMALALVTHVAVQVAIDVPPIFGLVLRTSTPIFLILFGAMIALVHLPRAGERGMAACAQANWTRAIQCYVLFLLNVAALSIAESYSASYALLCAAMLGTTPYAAILKYYTVMFVLMPATIALLQRVPVQICFAAACLFQLAYPLLKAVPNPPALFGQPILERLATFTVGTGVSDELAGPSIVHSLVLVFGGYWIGAWLRQHREGQAGPTANGIRLRPLLIAFLVLGLASFAYTGHGGVDLAGLGGMRMRNLNHPGYVFLIGGASLLLIIALRVCFRDRGAPGWMLLLGRRSLFAFGFGNAIISLWPAAVANHFGTAVSAVVLLAVLVVVVAAYDTVMRSGGEGTRDPVGRAVRAVAGFSGVATSRLAAMLVGTAQRLRWRRVVPGSDERR